MASSHRLRTVATFVVLLAFFMDLLDSTIVNIAIPSIQANLGASYSAISWLIAGYSLAFALLLITGGRLGDIYGYKRVFLVGIAGFTLASLAAGLAPTTEFLIAARIFQGGMAALMVPQILSLIQVMYEPRERGGISAFYGALGGLASVAGPILGAILIKWNFLGTDWRMIFLVNLPVGIFAFIAATIALPNNKSPHPIKLDIQGSILVIAASFLLVFPLIQGRELGWPIWAFQMMAAAVPLLAIFAYYEIRKDRRTGSALIVPSLFAHRSFVAGALINLTFFGSLSGFFLIFTLFLQVGLGYSILQAGLSGIPFSIGIGVTAGIAGAKLAPRFGRWVPTAGSLIMALGFIGIVLTVGYFDANLTPWQLVPALLVSGIGMGMIVSTIFQFILADVPIKDAGSASGIANAMGQLGGAIGVALIGVIFFGTVSAGARVAADDATPVLQSKLVASGLDSTATANIVNGFRQCFVDRAQEKDSSIVPESCKTTAPVISPELTQLAASDPAVKARLDQTNAQVSEAVAAAAVTGRNQNFIYAFTNSLIYVIAGLMIVCVITFYLPRKPLASRSELT